MKQLIQELRAIGPDTQAFDVKFHELDDTSNTMWQKKNRRCFPWRRKSWRKI